MSEFKGTPVTQCGTCGSKHPHLHPAVQFGGEVNVCADAFHLTETPMNPPEFILQVWQRRAAKALGEGQ